MQRPVEFEDVLVDARVVPEVCDGFAVKTVDVLRDGLVDAAGVLESGECVVGRVRSNGTCDKGRRRLRLRSMCVVRQRRVIDAPVTLPGRRAMRRT
jgi:hypothetical protein